MFEKWLKEKSNLHESCSQSNLNSAYSSRPCPCVALVAAIIDDLAVPRGYRWWCSGALQYWGWIPGAHSCRARALSFELHLPSTVLFSVYFRATLRAYS